MAYEADGTIVVIRCVLMVMDRRHECGGKEKQYEKSGKVSMPDHLQPFKDVLRLTSDDGIVKDMS